MESNQNQVHVAFSVHDLADKFYNFQNSTAVLSAIKNCSRPIIIHILSDKNSDSSNVDYKSNRDRYTKMCKNYNAEIQFHDVVLPPIYSEMPSTKFFTPGTYYRLFATEVLTDIDKVIYLDGDVIVNMDISELWDLDIGNNAIAARVDPMFQDLINENPKKIFSEYNQYGFTDDMITNYFNTGTMIMQLDIIREKYNLPVIATEFLKNNKNVPRADQDAFNYVMGSDCYHLDKKYNDFSYSITEYPAGDRIIHYCVYKPWRIIRNKVDYYYCRYALESPWIKEDDYSLQAFLNIINIMPETVENYKKITFSEKYHLTLLFGSLTIKHFFNFIINKIKLK